MANKRELTEDERTTITNGLRVAAEVFFKDAEIARTSDLNRYAAERLEDQFMKQYRDSLDLADLIDIVIEPGDETTVEEEESHGT